MMQESKSDKTHNQTTNASVFKPVEKDWDFDKIKADWQILHTVFNQSRNCIVVMNPAGEVMEINRRLLEFGGQNKDQIVGKPLWETRWWRFTNEGQERLRQAVKAAGKGKVENYETEIAGAGNKVLTVEICLTGVTDSHGELKFILLEARDISQEKALEEARSYFITTATHELRTPLTALNGYLALLEQELGSFSVKAKTYLGRIRHSATRLHNIVEGLLNVLRVEEVSRVDMSAFRIGSLVRDLVGEFENQIAMEDKQLKLQIEKDWLVEGNYEFTKKIISNLIDNAVKYTENGDTIRVTCRLQDQSDNDKVQITVEDTGVGIPEEHQEKIFEKFFRVTSQNPRKVKGSGLGLNIAKQLVEMQNGRLWVQSVEGKGSAFSFILKRADKSEQQSLLS